MNISPGHINPRTTTGTGFSTPQSQLVARLSLPGSAAEAPASEAEKIRKASSQFEALFLAQILRSARESAAGESSGDPSGQSMMEIAEEHIAHALAEHGGLGLAQSVMTNLGAYATARGAEGGMGTPGMAPAGK